MGLIPSNIYDRCRPIAPANFMSPVIACATSRAAGGFVSTIMRRASARRFGDCLTKPSRASDQFPRWSSGTTTSHRSTSCCKRPARHSDGSTFRREDDMPTLREIQRGFARAILLGDTDQIESDVVEAGLPASARLSIYRNTSRTVLTTALRLTFPVVDRLVGEPFFDMAAARVINRFSPRFAPFGP